MPDTASLSEPATVAEREIALKEREFLHRKRMDERGSRFQLSPWTAALIALMTSGITASVGGFWSRKLEADKATRDLALRQRDQEFQVVLKATENRRPEDAARNLLFFVDIGYLPDPTGAVRRKATAGEVPLITTGGTDNPIQERIQTAQSLAAGPAVQVAGVPFEIRNDVLLDLSGKPVSVVPTRLVGSMTGLQFVVLHSTWTATSRQATAALADSTRSASAHVVIDRDGTVTQLAPFDYATFHAGRGVWRGVSGLNRHSVGVELVNRGRVRRKNGGWVDIFGGAVPASEVEVSGDSVGWQSYPDVQVRRTVEVLRLLRAAYPSITEIVTHAQINPQKQEPGPAFPLDRVISLAH
jgi:N-acetylmuramoyl-L-alanine amidase